MAAEASGNLSCFPALDKARRGPTAGATAPRDRGAPLKNPDSFVRIGNPVDRAKTPTGWRNPLEFRGLQAFRARKIREIVALRDHIVAHLDFAGID